VNAIDVLKAIAEASIHDVMRKAFICVEVEDENEIKMVR
jgi:hypothetical protein